MLEGVKRHLDRAIAGRVDRHLPSPRVQQPDEAIERVRIDTPKDQSDPVANRTVAATPHQMIRQARRSVFCPTHLEKRIVGIAVGQRLQSLEGFRLGLRCRLRLTHRRGRQVRRPGALIVEEEIVGALNRVVNAR